MKMKLGIIDFSIDNWHAENYPSWILSSIYAAHFKRAYAWEKYQKPGGIGLDEWCRKHGYQPASSNAEVVDRSDAILVLAPHNPEAHFELAEPALKSGKPVFIDKPLTTDKISALRMFELATSYATPLMSSSALRFGNQLSNFCKKLNDPQFPRAGIETVQTSGGGDSFQEYGIHQIEMLVAVMGIGAQRMMYCQSKKDPASKLYLIQYSNHRICSIIYYPSSPFEISITHSGRVETISLHDMMYENLFDEILLFFMTKKSPIHFLETIEVSSILGGSLLALKNPDVWIDLR